MVSILRLCAIFFVIQGSGSLRDVRLVAPGAVRRGASFEMRCLFDTEQEQLYSVKWYRGDREFARYSPRDVPPLKLFQIPGIDVVREESDSSRLTIARATPTAHGRYTCEVSADAPSFQTAQLHATVHVVDFPPTGPEVNGVKMRYRVGVRLSAECVSRHSLPPANLSFYVNNEPAETQHVWHRVETEPDSQLMTSYSVIQFTVQRSDFVRHKLKIRCTARVYSAYHKSTEKCALEEREEKEDQGELGERGETGERGERGEKRGRGEPRATTSISNIVQRIVYPRQRVSETGDEDNSSLAILASCSLTTLLAAIHLFNVYR